jgi:peptidoglycan-N-acetylglucosamine deacetylase
MKRRAKIAVWLAGTLLLLLVMAFGLRTLARSRSYQVAGALFTHAETAERRVALTFDDGPVPAMMDSVLLPLERRGVHATFFVMGSNVAEAPAAAARLVASGHELGNHTYTHRRMVAISGATIRDEVERTDSLIRRAGHSGPIHFRPPFGYKLFGLPRYLARTGRTTVMWDVDPDSYPEVAAHRDSIVSHVLARVRPGSIILLHPWYPSRATSLAAVGPLIDSLRARGYQVGTVRELLVAKR